MRAILLAVLLAAQQQPYIETFEVRLHNLDVVVTDRAGKPVEGLTKDDFVVIEDGKVQEITNFAVYGDQVDDRRSRLSTEQGQAGVPVLHRPSRKFIFFLDELMLHPASRAKLLKNAVGLMKSSMNPGDVASVVRPYGEQNILLDFTSDQKAIEKALRKALEESNTRTNTQMAGELRWLESNLAMSSTLQEKNFAVRIYSDIARRRVEQRLGQIRALIGSVAATEGKKILVLMTASLPAHPGREAFNLADIKMGSNPATDKEVPGSLPQYPDMTGLIADIGRMAAAAGVTMYMLQPDVPLELANPGGEKTRQLTSIEPQTGRPMPPQHSLSENFFGLILDNTEITMASLAEQTGGGWYRGDGRVAEAFQQIGNDLRSYYSLAYHAKGSGDAVRKVEVRVKGRDDLRVRARTEVIEKSASREMADLVVASLVYPRTVNELGIRATHGAPAKVRGRFSVPVEAQIPMDKLTFLPGPDGKYHARFAVHYSAIGERADFAAAQERREEIVLSAEDFKYVAGKTHRYTSDLIVAQGRVRIAVGVLDLTSKLSGFANLEVQAQ